MRRIELILVWMLCQVGFVKLADMVAYIFSYSFRMGVVPEHWKRSIVKTTTVVM